MIYFTVTLLLICLDQGIKFLVRAQLEPTDMIQVIPNLIHLTYQENRGISFSLLSELPEKFRQPALSGISLLVILGLLFYLWRHWVSTTNLERWGLMFILSGAIGNLIDRAFRGSVTDYMYFHFYDTAFFVNNLADDLISIGFLVLLYYSYRKSNAK